MAEETAQRSGAELLIEALKMNDLTKMYGVVGIPVTDFARLAQLRGMKYYGFRREDAAVDAAAAEGFLTGNPGVGLTISAPGFLNGLTALAQATKNCFPLIMISGSSERHVIDLDRGDYEGLDQYNVAKPFCKAAYRVDRAQDVGLAVARAVRTALSGRPGGVYLDVPASTLSDVVADGGDQTLFEVVDPAPVQLPSPAAIDRAVDLLKGAKHPLVIIGKGAAYGRAEAEVKDFIDQTKFPFLPMSMAKGLLPDDHPSSVAVRSLSLKEADVVVLLGARLNWLLSNGEAPHFSPDAKFIQVDIDASEFDSNRQIHAPLRGDLKAVVAALGVATKAAGIVADQAWLDLLGAKVQENKDKMAARLATKRQPLGYYGALIPLMKLFKDHPDTYLVSEGANTLDIGRNLIDLYLPRHRLDTGTWGVMGVGLGYAIGAAVAMQKPVIALEGDSAFGFDGMEMETICRYHLPVTVMILNNGGIYNGDDQEVPDQPGPAMLDATAKYELLATAFGGDAYSVTTQEEMEDALTKAYASGCPNIINVTIDPKIGKESGHIGNLNPKINLSK